MSVRSQEKNMRKLAGLLRVFMGEEGVLHGRAA